MLLDPVVPKLDARYAYISGVVRSLEKKMLKKIDYQKMTEAPLEEMKQIFQDASYSFDEDSLNNEAILLAEFVTKNSFDAEFTDMFKLRWDYKKAASYLRHSLRDQEIDEDEVISGGIYAMDEFVRQMESGRSQLPEELGKAMTKARADFEIHQSNARIDSIMSREYFASFFSKVPDKNLKDYFSVIADSINLLTAIRYSEKGLHSDDFAEFYIPHGFIPADLLDEIWETDRSALASKMASSKYGKELSDALSSALSERDLTIVEGYFNQVKLNLLGRSIYSAFGLEVLVAYYEKKMIEIETLRKILRVKLSGLSESDIRKVVSYVLV